ncbi:DNA repair exonuclease [Neobacillus notoginsengisoli]|uniref:DNA repair exonuclease n=1 Tax=Neobacillus notoginsengisoli TaxID=1578198 RepID=A0A417YZM0_9BACI|nr:DNA repair exonuclease [Neobacillus notoginsengisoli]RHW43121.1 DNA repair exonuclease [Neobacillus notoginsengisoli]
MKKVTFIHAADLHLDSPMAGLKNLPEPIFARLKESTFSSLRKIVDAAISNEVDFVILAGDLYDGEDRSLKAQSRFRAEMERLLGKGIPVFAIHGNHDHLGGSWVKMQMPENVHIFGSKTESVLLETESGAAVNLYGFSYPTRHVTERKIHTYEKAAGGDFHIGILHGSDGSTTEHGSYCPFAVGELLEKQFDYWALGHIHKRALLAENPPIVYPGNIQGRNRKETGEKGCYLVSLDEAGANLEFMETNDIVWHEADISARGITDFDGIYRLLLKEKEKFRRVGKGVLLSVILRDIGLAGQDELDSLHSNLLELLQDGEEDESSFVWTTKVQVLEEDSWERGDLAGEADFYNELFQVADGFGPASEVLEPLYGRLPARKHVSTLGKEEEALLLEEAERLLIRLLRN